MREFKKFDFASRNTSVSSENSSSSSFRLRRIHMSKRSLLIAVLIIGVLGILSFIGIVLPAQRTYASAMKTYAQARVAWTAIKQQNIAQADTELQKTKADLEETQKSLHAFSYAGYIPLVGGYYNDADHMLAAGFHSLNATLILVDSVKPYADVLGLKGQGSFAMGTAENRIQTAILTMGKITPRIDDIAGDFELAQKEIDQVNPNHYPSFMGLAKIHNQIATVKTMADEGVTFVNEARPLIKVLPSLLGESKERKYLILFQNDKELRPTGGFITAYAVFGVDRGIIKVDKSSDIYNLDNTIYGKPTAPAPILKYLPQVTQLNLRDTNLSPDYVESMKTFNSLYNKASDKVAVDGILALDTHVLASVIKILDDEVVAGGIKFTSKTESRCGCPQVVYQLEQLTDKPKSLDLRVTSLQAVNSSRKDIIGVLLYAIMQKALKSSPKLYWGPLVQSMISETNQKHVLFYLFDQDAQGGIEALNAAGRIKNFEGDYLHINDSNMGGAKSNMFVKQTVAQSYDVSSSGEITKTITVTYKNPFPPSNCNLEAGLVCLNATLRDWVRVYVPKGSQLVKAQGSQVKVTSYEELGKTVFDGFITVNPQGSATYTITYKLPFKVSSSSMPLLIQKQPGTDGVEQIIKKGSRELQKFTLDTDTEIKIDL